MILKSETRGRVRTPPERRAALLVEYDRSGLSAARIAALAGVRYQTFATWVQQRRKARGGGKEAEVNRVRLVEVVPQATPSPARSQEGLQVHLPGGARLVITDAAQVPLAVQLIQALA